MAARTGNDSARLRATSASNSASVRAATSRSPTSTNSIPAAFITSRLAGSCTRTKQPMGNPGTGAGAGDRGPCRQDRAWRR